MSAPRCSLYMESPCSEKLPQRAREERARALAVIARTLRPLESRGLCDKTVPRQARRMNIRLADVGWEIGGVPGRRGGDLRVLPFERDDELRRTRCRCGRWHRTGNRRRITADRRRVWRWRRWERRVAGAAERRGRRTRAIRRRVRRRGRMRRMTGAAEWRWYGVGGGAEPSPPSRR